MGEVAANVSQRREHGAFPSHLDRTALQRGTIIRGTSTIYGEYLCRPGSFVPGLCLERDDNCHVR